MAKERRVVYRLEVEAGSGATAAVSSLSKGFKQVAEDAERARRAIIGVAEADRQARTRAAGGGAGGGAGVGSPAGRAAGVGSRSGPSSFSAGMRAGDRILREERIEREANIRALTTEASRRREVATAGESMARSNLRIIDGYRQIGVGATQAARSIVLLTAANSESAEQALRMIATFESFVQLGSAVKNIGSGLAKVGGFAGGSAVGRTLLTAGRALPAAAPAALVTATAISAGYSAYRIGQAFSESGDFERRRRGISPAPRLLTEDEQHQQRVSYFDREMAGVTARQSEMERFEVLREIGAAARDRIGTGPGLKGEFEANANNRARWEAELARGRRMQMFDLPGALEKVSDTPGGQAMAWTGYATSQVEGSAIEKRAQQELLKNDVERLRLTERRGQIDLQNAMRAVELAKQSLDTETERLAVLKRETMTTKEIYGDADPGERARLKAAIAAAEEAERTKNPALVTQEHRKSLREFNLPLVAQPYAIAEAGRDADFPKIDAFLERLLNTQQKVVDAIEKGVKEAEAKAAQQTLQTGGLVNAVLGYINTRARLTEEAGQREIQAAEQQAAIKAALERGGVGGL